MSLEPEIAPSPAETPPVPAPASTDDDANLREAARAVVGDRALSPAAEAQLLKLWSADLKGVDVSLLKGAIARRVESGDYDHFLRPARGDDPYSREAVTANYQAHQPARAGVRTAPDGRRIWSAAGKSPAQQQADMEAHEAAMQRREAAAQFARELAALPPGAARLEHLAAAVRAGRDAQGSPPALKTRPRSK